MNEKINSRNDLIDMYFSIETKYLLNDRVKEEIYNKAIIKCKNLLYNRMVFGCEDPISLHSIVDEICQEKINEDDFQKNLLINAIDEAEIYMVEQSSSKGDAFIDYKNLPFLMTILCKLLNSNGELVGVDEFKICMNLVDAYNNTKELLDMYSINEYFNILKNEYNNATIGA